MTKIDKAAPRPTVVAGDSATALAASAPHGPRATPQRAGILPDQAMPHVGVGVLGGGNLAAARARLATFDMKLTELAPARPAEALLAAHRSRVARHPVSDARPLVFDGVDGMNVYNPTAPFEIGGRRVLAARVEEPDDETATRVCFFAESAPGRWRLIADAPSFAMQDPFVCHIAGQVVLGGVETYERLPPKEGVGYRTVFYRGANIDALERFAVGPDDMKDIRLQELGNGSILVLTRPQHRISGNTVDAGRGKIGYAVIDDLDSLANPATIARLVEATQLDQFVAGEWGGANEMHDLGGGKVGVLGHIARFSDDEKVRHYYAFVFTIDTVAREVSPISIILQRDDIDPERLGGTRREDLWDVLFSGGLVRHGDGTAELYVGAGDKESWSARIRDPF